MTFALTAAAAATFNLVCSGNALVWFNGKSHTEAYESTFRVDLRAGRYCAADCEETKAIQRVTPTEIVFLSRSDPEFREMKVNRASGAYQNVAHDGRGGQSFRGQCQRRAFTGFPTRQF